ncbi:hypothetical protein [Caldanaerobius polysaccharolyticus]|uniref:hypothetical protein n=1 Tax=Caldanaerobius polysaccharolyticus TaxID=44256 RepID=UPI00047B4944|nr:hypothetical protein [Caldanaerobius polysaccharolyticus]
MKDIICDDFQNTVRDVLIRHKSILDVMSKLQETDARINRALAKSVTICGCLKIEAHKQEIPEDIDFEDLPYCVSSHLKGELCDDCREVIEKEITNHIFYIAALCNLLKINMFDLILNEYRKLNFLGAFTLT